MSIVLARDGRQLGIKARQSREELLLALLGMIRDGMPWHDIQPTLIARRANASPAKFYQFFADATDAVKVLHQHLEERGKPIPPHLEAIMTLLRFEAEMPRKAQSP